MANNENTLSIRVNVSEGNAQAIADQIHKMMQDAVTVNLGSSGGFTGRGGPSGGGGSASMTSAMAMTATISRPGMPSGPPSFRPISGPGATASRLESMANRAGWRASAGFPSDSGSGPAYDSSLGLNMRAADMSSRVNAPAYSGVAQPGGLGYPDQSGLPVGPPSMRFNSQAFGKGALVAGGRFLEAEAQLGIQSELTGRTSVMGQAGAWGGLAGGLVGAGIGGLLGGGPFGGYIGAGIGTGVGSTAAQWLMAPVQADIDRQRTMAYAAALGTAGMPFQSVTPIRTGINALDRNAAASLSPSLARGRAYAKFTEGESARIRNEYFGGSEQFAPTANEIAEGFGSVWEAFSNSGDDPDALASIQVAMLDGYAKKTTRRQMMINGVPLTERKRRLKTASHLTTTTSLPDEPGYDEVIPGTPGIPGRKGVVLDTGQRLPDRYTMGDTAGERFDPGPVGQGRRMANMSYPVGENMGGYSGPTVIPGQRGTPGTPARTLYRAGRAGGTTTTSTESQQWEWFDQPVFEDVQEDDKSKPIYHTVQATRAQEFYHNILTRGGTAGPRLAQMAARVQNNLSSTGDKIPDLLMAYGPDAVTAYEMGVTTAGQPMPVSLPQLRKAYSGMQAAQHMMALDATGARGVSAHSLTDIGFAQDAIRGLPDGPASLTYHQLNAQRRQFQIGAYEEEDTVAFGIPGAKLAGQRARTALLPFSPGNSYKIDLETLQLNTRYQSKLTTEMDSLRKKGDLSESLELNYTQRLESLKTQSAGMIANLSEGVIDRLPGMNAGSPSFFSRYTNMSLAAANLGRNGSVVRSYGAANGSQMQMQNDFVSSFNVPGSIGPYSRTESLNNAPVVDVLRQILAELKSTGRSAKSSNGVRPGEVTGAMAAANSRQHKYFDYGPGN